jgi:hypothetical protein
MDKGEAFAVGAATGIELGVVCLGAFVLAYGTVSTFAGWRPSLAAAIIAYAAAAWATQDLEMTLATAAGAGALSLGVALMLLPAPRTVTAIAALPWWDIPVRMLATLGLVALIVLSADALGPRLSGIVATYPSILTVLGAFTHHQWGRDAVRGLLRGATLSLFSFVAFFLVIGAGMPALGLVPAFVLASAVALATTAVLVSVRRQR